MLSSFLSFAFIELASQFCIEKSILIETGPKSSSLVEEINLIAPNRPHYLELAPNRHLPLNESSSKC